MGIERGKDALLLEARAAARHLPAKLRTEHWYNDWQHAVFITIFKHLNDAIRADKRAMSDRLIDKLTVYLFVHFLCEEEGMSWAVKHDELAAETMSSHQNIHMAVLQHWHRTIQGPYKDESLARSELADRIEDFYGRILTHIEETDQATYGQSSNRGIEGVREEIAHIAACGLPLSPNMRGAGEVVSKCCRDTFSLIQPQVLPLQATHPLKQLNLTRPAEAEADSLRRRFFVKTESRFQLCA